MKTKSEFDDVKLVSDVLVWDDSGAGGPIVLEV